MMHPFAKRLVVLATVIHIVPSAAFADWLIDGVLMPDDARVVPPSAGVPESQQRFLGAWGRPLGRHAQAHFDRRERATRWQRKCHLRLGSLPGPEHHARL
jgi:hypothetical protein